MIIYIYVNSEKQVTGWANKRSTANEIPIDVDESHEIFTNPFSFKYENGVLIKNNDSALALAKKKKEIELDNACQKAILDGFDYEIDGVLYHFSFDTEAQLNFQGADRILDKGIVSSVGWTAKRDGTFYRLSITRNIMDGLLIKILQHKDYNVRKFREILLPEVNKAQTIADVNRISWDMTI